MGEPHSYLYEGISRTLSHRTPLEQPRGGRCRSCWWRRPIAIFQEFQSALVRPHPGLVDVTGAPRRTPSVRSAPTSMELLASNVHSPKEPRTRPLRRGLGPLRTLAFEGPDSKRVYTLACTAGPRQLH